MEDNTTTDAPAQDTGADTSALPDQAESTSAGTETSDQSASTEQTSEETSTDDGPDEATQKFAASHGLELDSPSAIKAAKIAMSNQAEFHRTRQKASHLEKSMLEMGDANAEQVAAQTGQDPELLKRVQRMEIRDAKRSFFDEHATAAGFEDEIKEKILDSGISGSPENVLKAAWAMVQAENPDLLRSEGARTALNNLASKQRAAAPTGSAVSSAPTKTTITQSQIREHLQVGDVAWYEKNLSTINKLVAEGKLEP